MQGNEIDLGNYVKIVTSDDDDNYGKIGFVGDTVQKFVKLFSIYSFKGEQIVCFGDYSSSELTILEGKVSKEDLIRRIESERLSDVMVEEMQKLLNSLYQNNS